MRLDDISDIPESSDIIPEREKEHFRLEDIPETFRLDEIPETEEESAFGAFMSELGKGIVSFSLAAGGAAVGTAETFVKYAPAFKKLYGIEIPQYDPYTGEWVKRTGFETFEETKKRISLTRDKFPMTHEGTAAWTGRIIGEAIPFMGAALAAGYTIGPVLGPFLTGFTIEGDMAYEEAKKKGASEAQAQLERVLVGSINGYIETLQIGKIMKFHTSGSHTLKNLVRLAKSKAYKTMAKVGIGLTGDILKTSVQEAAQEFIQEGVSIATPAVLRGDIIRTPDGKIDIAAIGERLGRAALGGGVVGGLFAGGGAAISAGYGLAAPSDVEIDNTIARINESELVPSEKTRLIKNIERLRETPREVSRTELDDSIDKLQSAIDEVEVLVPQEKETIRKELGKRFADFSEVLQDEPNPILAQAIARRALAGRMKLQIEPFIEKTFTEDDAKPLYDAVRNSSLLEGQMLDVFDGLNSLIFDGTIPAKHEIAAMSEVFGTDIAESLMQKRKQLGISKWETFVDAINIPRAILASYDMSAPLRQGLLMLPIVPKEWIKSVGKAYRAFTNPLYAEFVDTQIRTHPMFGKLQKSGLFLSKAGMFNQREEYFRSSMADRIPYAGVGIRASERAYTTFLNSVRAGAFYHFCEQWEGTGKTAADYKSLANFINHATGRGDPKWLEKHVDLLNIGFFAPRLFVGRIQVLTDLFTATSPVRKIIAGDLAVGVGTGLLVLTLLSYIDGVDVEKNPLSTDFGKVRVGNTRVDFWGGYLPMARTLVQLVAGKRKTTESKRIILAKRGDVLWRFVQSKLAPPAGFVLDMARGETFLGRKLRFEAPIIGREAYERFMPLFIQDVIDAARFQGLTGVAIVAPSALHGVGAQTYPPTAVSESAKIKDRLSQQYFGQNWDAVGPLAQKALRTANPIIELMEEKSRMEREDYSFMERIGEQEADSARKVYNKLPKPIQKELDSLYVRIGGLSRTISSDWFLNEDRYVEYQKNTTMILQKILPAIILNPNYKNLSFDNKRLILEYIIDTVKKAARDKIIKEANTDDLVSRENLK